MFEAFAPISDNVWQACFNITISSPTGDYSHLHLALKPNAPLDDLRQALKPFYELAHQDARRKFNQLYRGISLDPIASSSAHISYPHSLPETTKKGFFGEIFCGIISKNFSIPHHPNWKIPACLFRHHQTAAEYLHRLGEGGTARQSVIGRTGNDFLALTFDNDFRITNCLVSESKCYTKYNSVTEKGALETISKESVNPVSLGQLIDVIKDNAFPNAEQIINAIENVLYLPDTSTPTHQRIDLFLFAFENPSQRIYPPTRMSQTEKSSNYTATRRLQVVEIFFPDMMSFINDLYSNLYR